VQVRASPIPIVLAAGDPVRAGVVASMNRPGGNVTGVAALTSDLSGKQLSLLHDLVPKAATIAALVERSRSRNAVPVLRDDARHRSCSWAEIGFEGHCWGRLVGASSRPASVSNKRSSKQSHSKPSRTRKRLLQLQRPEVWWPRQLPR
jgi:hypothetical protein